MRKALQFILFLSFGLFIFYLVYLNQTEAYAEYCDEEGIPAAQCNLGEKLISDFGKVNWAWIAVVMLVFSISNYFRAVRWQMQYAAMGYPIKRWNAFWSIIFGYFANLGFPRMGEVLRAGMISKYDEVPMEKSVSTLVIDRLADLVVLLGIVAIALLVEFDTIVEFIRREREKNAAESGAPSVFWDNLFYILGGFVLGVSLAVFVFRKKIQQLSVFQVFKEKAIGFWQGLVSIRHLNNPLKFSLLSIGIWVMFYLQCLFTLWSFPPTAHLGIQPALLVFILGTLGFIIPTPGGMGSYHALAIGALTLYSIKGPDAFSFANIGFFTITIFYNLVGGVLALVLLPRMNKKMA